MNNQVLNRRRGGVNLLLTRNPPTRVKTAQNPINRTIKTRHSPRVEIKGVEQTKTSELLRLRKIAMQPMQMLLRIMARLAVPKKKARVQHSSNVAAVGVVTGPKPLQLLTIRSSIIFSRTALK